MGRRDGGMLVIGVGGEVMRNESVWVGGGVWWEG